MHMTINDLIEAILREIPHHNRAETVDTLKIGRNGS